MPASDPAVVLEQAVERAVRRRVGVVAGHVTADGVTTIRGAGVTRTPDGTIPGGDTLFEIGSVTKTFTALVLARTVVDGDLSLDTEIGDLVEELAGLGRDGVPVTLGHLATHTSGLPRVHLPLVRGSVEMLRGLDPYADVTEDGLVESIRDGELKHTPGTGSPAYSNSGYGLLGIALSRHAGLPYGDLVRRRVTEPLGMSDTVVRDQRTADQRGRTAIGHHWRRTPASSWPLAGLPGAGALLSTADDLLTFARAHLAPPEGALGAAIEMAVAEHAPSTGLAWQQITAKDGDLVVWHNGGTGGFRSILALRPGAGEGLVMLTNHARSLDLVALRLLRTLATR